MNDFIKERNEALLSLDKNKIIAYMNKYNIIIPKDEKIFWLECIKLFVVYIL